ncbi:hypothetical protein HK103_005099 [Boothiomyces macroporosus]|uniref:HMG box domain-containing protein n=1 Tax=Boothiomyces macroporosus TaxID=261099 RepID=A0AAD5UG64_9FUNG|nr:hypothetical protein HK103_005099 [Boothiomyces macroporosus]
MKEMPKADHTASIGEKLKKKKTDKEKNAPLNSFFIYKKYMRDKIREKYNLTKSHEITQMAAACWAIETDETKAKFLNISKDLYKKHKESMVFMNMEHVQSKAINPELCLDEFQKNGQRKNNLVKMPLLLPQLKSGELPIQEYNYPKERDNYPRMETRQEYQPRPEYQSRQEYRPPRLEAHLDYSHRYNTDYHREYPREYDYIPERFPALQSPTEIRSYPKNNLDSLLNPVRQFGVEPRPLLNRDYPEYNPQDPSPPDSPVGSPELVANLPGAGIHSLQSVSQRDSFPDSARPSVDIYALFM